MGGERGRGQRALNVGMESSVCGCVVWSKEGEKSSGWVPPSLGCPVCGEEVKVHESMSAVIVLKVQPPL